MSENDFIAIFRDEILKLRTGRIAASEKAEWDEACGRIWHIVNRYRPSYGNELHFVDRMDTELQTTEVKSKASVRPANTGRTSESITS